MKHVILISDEHGAPAEGLVESLRAAGFQAEAQALPVTGAWPAAASDDDAAAPGPCAVLLELGAGAELARVHDAARVASAAWPGSPLVAFRSDAPQNGHAPAPNAHASATAPRLDASTLERLGFRAVADEPAQLPALLRALESRGLTGELCDVVEAAGRADARVADTPSSLLLPERLGVQQLRAAFETVALLHFSNDQKSAASAALVGLASLVAADRWTIYLVSEAGGDDVNFEPLAARGLTPSEQRDPPADDWRRTLFGDVLALAGAESDAARAAVLRAETARGAAGGRHVLAVPLVDGERVMGVLEAVRESTGARAFAAPDESLLSALALPLAAALSNSVRIAEAERLSQTDDLTKLHNARFLRQYLIAEVRRARRYGSMVSAMFLDLDDFKTVNDRHGHLVGSHVLMEMAAVILSSVRDTDVVARYGGDEFVVILPETGAEQSAGVAERVRATVAEHTFSGGRNLRLRLTASFGVASFPAHAHSPQQLVAAADAAMYEAKAAHKNCVRFAPEGAD
jgi:diguanylate cyclase (GGDEF)-like protein